MVKIETNKSLKSYNTFGVEVQAKQFVQFDEPKDVFDIDWKGGLIWGGGSNVLCCSKFIEKVIFPNIEGIEVVEEDDDLVVIEVGAGVIWDDLVAYCVDKGYGGIENLSLIPGKVGAAPIQNIGAYGVELKDVLKKVVFYNYDTAELEDLSNDQCQFGYRDSIFKHALKGKMVILKVVFTLTKHKHQFNVSYAPLGDSYGEEDVVTLQNIREKVIAIRKSKLPDPSIPGQGNAGSFFKNPIISKAHYTLLKEEHGVVPGYPLDDQSIKVPAAWLIQEAGWKGRKLEQVQCNPLQPLVVMNLGDATGLEIKAFAEMIQKDVQELYNIQLDMEVNII